MNERTELFGIAVLIGVTTMQVSPIMGWADERPGFVPTVLGGLMFGTLLWLIYPLLY